jgi:hypothetical protein
MPLGRGRGFRAWSRRHDAHLGVLHLPSGLGGPSKLFDRLGDVQDPFDVRLREQPAMGVDRQVAADLDPTSLHPAPTLALRAEPVVLERDQGVAREAVVDLVEVHVLRSEAGEAIRLRRRDRATQGRDLLRLGEIAVRVVLSHPEDLHGDIRHRSRPLGRRHDEGPTAIRHE